MLAPFNHKEADSRMFVHAKHASSTGSRTLTIVSSDTDVVVLAIAVYAGLNIDAFGKGKKFRWIPVDDVCEPVGPRSKALPFFMLLQVVTLFLPLSAKARNLHGRYGMCMKKLLKYFIVSVLPHTQLLSRKLIH